MTKQKHKAYIVPKKEVSDMKKLFIYIKNKLLEQSEPSIIRESNLCVYRHPERNLKCAVGWVMSDKYYKKRFEGENVLNEQLTEAVEKSIGRSLSDIELRMLECLQEIHDDVAEEEIPTVHRIWENKLEILEARLFSEDQ